jgi:hypothetical protein
MIDNAEKFKSIKANVEEYISSGEYGSKFSLTKTFSTGTQGICGILSSGDVDVVFKSSQYIDYIAEHEYNIMLGLDKISEFCPHFCRSLGFVNFSMEPKFKEKTNPFEVVSKYPIKKGVLLEELVEGSKMSDYIISRNIDMLIANVKQVLAAITIAQNSQNFSHYDLHSDNVLLLKCSKDDVSFYIFDKENTLLVPTHGYYPKIIDFGFAYNDNMNDNYATTGICFTDSGMMSDRFDWIADFKVFLISVSKDIKDDIENSSKSIKFRDICRNIFSGLKLDWKTGWDADDKKDYGASTLVMDKLNDLLYMNKSIFRDNGYACIDIIQSMLILPLEKKPSTEIAQAYPAFLREFRKIEIGIKSSTYTMYILKCLVDSAKKNRKDYINESTRVSTVKKFRVDVLDAIMSVSKFFTPSDLKYELMLCSLYSLSDCIEGLLYKYIEKRVEKKGKIYEKVIPKSNTEIVNIIDANFEDKLYKYSEKTCLNIFDAVKKCNKRVYLTAAQAKKMNALPRYFRSNYALDIYNGTNTVKIPSYDPFHEDDTSDWSSEDLSESDILGEGDDY